MFTRTPGVDRTPQIERLLSTAERSVSKSKSKDDYTVRGTLNFDGKHETWLLRGIERFIEFVSSQVVEQGVLQTHENALDRIVAADERLAPSRRTVWTCDTFLVPRRVPIL